MKNRFLPQSILSDNRKAGMTIMSEKIKQPWPTKAVMEQIYEQKLWGGNDSDFYSGEGSHDPKIIKPYLEQVITFLKTHNHDLTVCDLGCGDFNIGKHLVPYTKHYHAIDIVEDLITRNQKLFTEDHLEFHCLDISKDELPDADCIILRQVLQHLSNAEIHNITKKLANYKYIILTEHIPQGDFLPNQDIISGQGIRIKQNSGVNILEDPFNFKIKEQRILDDCLLEQKKGRIVTTLYIT